MISLDKSALEEVSNRVDHAADYYSRYPGETVVFFTRVAVSARLEQFAVRITLPPGMTLISTKSFGKLGRSGPVITQDEGATHIIWNLQKAQGTAQVYEYETAACILALQGDVYLDGVAVLSAQLPDEQMIFLSERVSIVVKAKARTLQYLPSIYHEDELMARLLMLFESFLNPIEKQIDTQEYYLDPQMTPPQFLDWLAAWVGLKLDADISDQRRRLLLKESARLYKIRGTRQGLIEYLEIICGGKVEIVEHFSENFRLGAESYMGPGIALGKENIPNTFGVKVVLPELPDEVNEGEKKRNLLIWERKTQAIIDAEKPVHSGYELSLEYGAVETSQAA